MVQGIRGREFGKSRAGHWSGGNSVLCFEHSAVIGDTRRAAISPTNAENDSIPFILDLEP
jgi:hypothetical protein